MASVTVDGPRAWARVVDRKLARVIAGVGGGELGIAVMVADPGASRTLCAVGAVALFFVASRPRSGARGVHLVAEDLIPIEAEMLRWREWAQDHDRYAKTKADEVLTLVEEIRQTR